MRSRKRTPSLISLEFIIPILNVIGEINPQDIQFLGEFSSPDLLLKGTMAFCRQFSAVEDKRIRLVKITKTDLHRKKPRECQKINKKYAKFYEVTIWKIE